MNPDPYSLNLPEDHALYAAVIAHGKVLSSLWRIWTKGDDIYMAVPTLRKDFKTSLHASGKFRHAFGDQQIAARFLGEGRDRAVEKWKRPNPTPEGVIWLMQVAIPGVGLGANLDRYVVPNTTWPLLVPGMHEMLLLSLLLMPPEFIGRSIGLEDRRLHVLDAWRLKSGRAIAVACDVQPLPKGLEQFMMTLSAAAARAKEFAEDGTDVRLNTLVTLSAGGSKAILDCEVDALERWLAQHAGHASESGTARS